MDDASDVDAWEVSFDEAMAAGKFVVAATSNADRATKLHVQSERSGITHDSKQQKTEEERLHIQIAKKRAKAIAQKAAAPKDAPVLPLTAVSFRSLTPAAVVREVVKSEGGVDPVLCAANASSDTWRATDAVHTDVASFG